MKIIIFADFVCFTFIEFEQMHKYDPIFQLNIVSSNENY